VGSRLTCRTDAAHRAERHEQDNPAYTPLAKPEAGSNLTALSVDRNNMALVVFLGLAARFILAPPKRADLPRARAFPPRVSLF
jgi:hypothetical protein